MAKAIAIKAKPREYKTPNHIRREGFIPATVYGHGFKSESVQVNADEFSKVPHKVYSHINELDIDGQKLPVIIRNVHIDPVSNQFLNIEFYRIKSEEKVKVKVSIKYAGHSPAITAGGVLIVSLSEVEVQCLPKDIPDEIEVNLEQIQEIGQSIQIKDLKVSESIQVLARQEEVIVKVEIAKTHEIEEVKPAVEVPVAEAEALAAQAPETQEAVKEPIAEGKAPKTTETKQSKK